MATNRPDAATAYAELNADVWRIVNRNAEAAAKRHGITFEAAREDILARVTTKTYRPAHGTGH